MDLIDSHCHLDFPELATDLPGALARMASAGVTGALCVSVTLEDFPRVSALAHRHANIWATAGVHPDHREGEEPSVERIAALADDSRVVAIGETGLDYYRVQGETEWQRNRFRTHIRAAVEVRKPLIVHMRDSAPDTLRIMREEKAERVGGVMHCFTGSLEVAREAIELGFLISFSGIVTFKNAEPLKQVAQSLPLDRILVETDAPYLAPVPFRGKTNEPAFVRHVAEEVARLRGVSLEAVAEATTANFRALFRIPD